MTIVDNSTSPMVEFSTIAEGGVFKDSTGVAYLKKAVETSGNNATNMVDGTNSTFADTDLVQSVTAQLTLTN